MPSSRQAPATPGVAPVVASTSSAAAWAEVPGGAGQGGCGAARIVGKGGVDLDRGAGNRVGGFRRLLLPKRLGSHLRRRAFTAAVS